MRFEFDPTKVSFHAVARYVERILGLAVESDEVGRALAEACAAAAGLTVEEIQRRIYTPAAAAALAIGAPEFTVGGIRVLSREGIITTITTRSLPKRTSGRRLRVLTESENRRWLAKRARRIGHRNPFHHVEENGD